MVEQKAKALSILTHAQRRLRDVYNRRKIFMRNKMVKHKPRTKGKRQWLSKTF